ncbi:MAG: DUF2007 domain-containing protein [Pedobacter sp.]|nr:MAG: DUF2007 domain-containing protein [Pedobacter sp.]
MKNFITAAVFSYPHEITILKHLLETEGISHFFENETMMTIVPMYSNALGGIRLKVHPEDLEAVKAILKQLDTDEFLKIV